MLCVLIRIALSRRFKRVHTIYHYSIYVKKKITLNYSESAVMGFFPKGLKNEMETAVVNEPSVFEPQKNYCNCCM